MIGDILSFYNTNTVFDYMNLEIIRIKINDTKNYRENKYTCDFYATSLDNTWVYTSFLTAGLKTHID